MDSIYTHNIAVHTHTYYDIYNTCIVYKVHCIFGVCSMFFQVIISVYCRRIVVVYIEI